MRVAEEEDSGGGGDGAFHSLPVEGPFSVDFDVVDGDEVDVGVVMDADEWRIDGGAGHDGSAIAAEGTGGEGKRGDEPSEVDDVLARDFRVAPGFQVVVDGLVEAFVGLGVAEDAMVDALVQCGEDFRGGCEIHVSDPEGIELGAAVVFDASGAAAGDGEVEVKLHAGGISMWGGFAASP